MIFPPMDLESEHEHGQVQDQADACRVDDRRFVVRHDEVQDADALEQHVPAQTATEYLRSVSGSHRAV